MASEKIKPVVFKESYTPRHKISLLVGLPIFIAILLLPRPVALSLEGDRTLAVAALMVFWWVSEAVPIAATALIPLAFFPLLGIMESKDVAPSYGDNVIFLFMGGFFFGHCNGEVEPA